MRRKVEETKASRRARRAFTPSFKAEVVALVRQGDRTLPAICREMDLSETAVRRWALARGWADVDVAGCRIGVKVAHRAGRVVTATPEFRDLRAAASALDVPVRHVLERAVAAAVSAGLVIGAPVPAVLRDRE